MNQKAHGFTIVELLIVIVVIALLATISIVAYRGIQERANLSSASATAAQTARKILAYYTEHGTYPASLTDAGIDASAASAIQYSYNNTSDPKTYCLTTTTNTKSTYLNNTTATTPTPGGCPGHGQGGSVAVTNYARNPSLRVGTLSWHPGGSITRVSDAQATSGFAIEKSYASHQLYFNVSGLPGAAMSLVYSIDLWLPSDEPVESRQVSLWAETAGAPYVTWASQYVTVTKIKQRFYGIVEKTSGWTNGNVGIRNAANVRLRASAVLVSDAVGTPSYYDGDSPNWIWSGTPDNSTSTGPLL